jgi:hypothetical protein
MYPINRLTGAIKRNKAMVGEMDELKLQLDEVANDLAETVPEVTDWDQWLVYLLGGLELQSASLDSEHPAAYEAMLERFRQLIKARLKKGSW